MELLRDFIAEQNRLNRTRGLPKDHPDGKMEPCDIVMSVAERKFWEREEKNYGNKNK